MKVNVPLYLPGDVQEQSEQRERWNLRSDVSLSVLWNFLPDRKNSVAFSFFSLKARQSILLLSCLDFEILN